MLKIDAMPLLIYGQLLGFFWVNWAMLYFYCNKELQIKKILKFQGCVIEIFLSLLNVCSSILPLFIKSLC